MTHTQSDSLTKILEALKCIQCDGSGAVQVSEDEVEQCQFCAEIRYPFIETATEAIQALTTEAELKKDIRYHTLKARYERVFLHGEEKAMNTKRYVKSLKNRLTQLKKG